MDFSNSYASALKSNANRSRQRPPSFPPPPPPHYPNNSSLPESPSRLPEIPPDLVTEILLRLPIKSLLRFRCVCQQWRNSISDPQFTLSVQNRKIAFRYSEGLYDLNLNFELDKVSLVELRNPMGKKNIHGTEDVEIPRFAILGSCKGLLLIRDGMDLHLWNPSIRQCTKVVSLPQSDRLQCLRQRLLIGSGLCYDSSTDDYKAVIGYDGITFVVSLKSRRWTSFCFPYKLNSGPVVNERLHWKVNRDENGMQFPTQEIVYFDPLVDEFLEVPALPNQGERNMLLGLGVLDGCLCVARYVAYGYEPYIEVLIMKEYGVKESWTSLFVVSSFVGGSEDLIPHAYESWVPLCLKQNGTVLIAVNGENMVAYFPLDISRNCVIIPIKKRVRNVFSYEESLISPHLYGGRNDWIIKQVDAWNLVYDSDWGRPTWCECCAYEYPPLRDDMISECEEDNMISEWEEDDNLYDLEEEDFFKKEKEQHRMRIKTKNR